VVLPQPGGPQNAWSRDCRIRFERERGFPPTILPRQQALLNVCARARSTEFFGEEKLSAPENLFAFNRIRQSRLHAVLGPSRLRQKPRSPASSRVSPNPNSFSFTPSFPHQEIKEVMADAERKFHSSRRTSSSSTKFHRFNKSQQDAFLPYVEAATSPLSAPQRKTLRSK